MNLIFQCLLGAAILTGLSQGTLQGAENAANANSSTKLEWTFKRDEAGRLQHLRDPGGKETVFDYAFYPGEPQRIKTATRRFTGGETV